MNKKSYKRHQNRLYREIKRRIIAEKCIAIPPNVVKSERKIDTIRVVNMIPNNYMIGQHEEFIKTEMTRKIVDKLIAEGYIEFISCNQEPSLAIADLSMIRAQIHVVKPW